MNLAPGPSTPFDAWVRPEHRAMFCMLGFAVLWAMIEAMAAEQLGRYSPYQVVWTRYAVHLALMLLIWGRHDPAALWRSRRYGYQLARSMLMLGMPASWVIAMQLGVPPDTIMGVFWLSPLLILALSRPLLRERASLPLWIATGVALCGSWLLHTPGRIVPPHLLAFPLAMALCFSLYVVMSRPLRTDPTLVNLFHTALGVFVALTLAMPWLWKTPTPGDALVMVGIGIVGWFALWMLDRATALAPVSASAPVAYVQLLAFAAMTAIGGSMNIHSPRRMALGTFLIGGAVLYVWLRAPHLIDPSSKEERSVVHAAKES